MVDSADEARRLSALAAAALRLVNEVAAGHLIAAADRGDLRVQFPVEPVLVPVAAGLAGRLYDQGLIEALERSGQTWLARACRIFVALGFAVATVPEVEREEDVDRVADVVRRIRIVHLELGYAAAQDHARGAPPALLQAVALPAAYLWRARAESAKLIAQYERKALAAIAVQAERGADSCRLPWRDFDSGAVNAEHLQRLGDALRGRGFAVEAVDAGSTLRVNW
jgi:hypothetical protein